MDYYKNKELKSISRDEYWIPFPENKYYLISSLGRVKSTDKKVKHNYGGDALKKGRVLTQTDNGSGYLSVGLTFEGKTKTLRVSRIVAMTFLDNPKNKPHVNHINGVKYDNRVANLEWATAGENVRHSWANGLSKKQGGYLLVKEKLKKTIPYINYDVRVKTPNGYGRVIIDQNNYRIEYDNGKLEYFVKSIRFYKNDFKLILRGLGDLYKKIQHNHLEFTPIDWLLKHSDTDVLTEFIFHMGDFQDKPQEISWDCCPKWIFEKLFEWHFNVFNLPQDQFIDINTLED